MISIMFHKHRLLNSAKTKYFMDHIPYHGIPYKHACTKRSKAYVH